MRCECPELHVLAICEGKPLPLAAHGSRRGVRCRAEVAVDGEAKAMKAQWLRRVDGARFDTYGIHVCHTCAVELLRSGFYVRFHAKD